MTLKMKSKGFFYKIIIFAIPVLIAMAIYQFGYWAGIKSQQRWNSINPPDCSRCPSTIDSRSYPQIPIPTMVDFEPPCHPNFPDCND
jgi:hypothetical protein